MRRRSLRRRYGHALSSGAEVQSLLFPRKKFTVEGAELWAAHHDFKAGKADVTGDHVRLRQHEPGDFIRMRTIPFGTGGIKAVVGWRTR